MQTTSKKYFKQVSPISPEKREAFSFPPPKFDSDSPTPSPSSSSTRKKKETEYLSQKIRDLNERVSKIQQSSYILPETPKKAALSDYSDGRLSGRYLSSVASQTSISKGKVNSFRSQKHRHDIMYSSTQSLRSLNSDAMNSQVSDATKSILDFAKPRSTSVTETVKGFEGNRSPKYQKFIEEQTTSSSNTKIINKVNFDEPITSLMSTDPTFELHKLRKAELEKLNPNIESSSMPPPDSFLKKHQTLNYDILQSSEKKLKIEKTSFEQIDDRVKSETFKNFASIGTTVDVITSTGAEFRRNLDYIQVLPPFRNRNKILVWLESNDLPIQLTVSASQWTNIRGIRSTKPAKNPSITSEEKQKEVYILKGEEDSDKTASFNPLLRVTIEEGEVPKIDVQLQRNQQWMSNFYLEKVAHSSKYASVE